MAEFDRLSSNGSNEDDEEALTSAQVLEKLEEVRPNLDCER